MTITIFECSPDGGKGLARDTRVRHGSQSGDFGNDDSDGPNRCTRARAMASGASSPASISAARQHPTKKIENNPMQSSGRDRYVSPADTLTRRANHWHGGILTQFARRISPARVMIIDALNWQPPVGWISEA